MKLVGCSSSLMELTSRHGGKPAVMVQLMVMKCRACGGKRLVPLGMAGAA